MKYVFSFLALVLFSYSVIAQQKSSLVQVDLIIFSQNTLQEEHSLFLQKTMKPDVTIKDSVGKDKKPYHLLPVSASQLNNEYWQLKRKPQFQVLANYSWLQPKNSQKKIAFPLAAKNGWEVEGTLNLKPGNYILLSTEALFTPPHAATFKFTQQQRIKLGKVYYLDHPQAGMLIKIHQVG
ncbi:Protein of uncharacterised function (DUF2803) (plasmid) [Legionella adelaidensis]|uniref:Protein of uncharacterized function (DUF2803) n=1 Tax=Legionella adelaidensis TaxID=45056 RepID=A0A0W0R3E2_9GAMM|nr:CsiV family protein [Legionella adelaidensis]KTC65601.1 hypothetical protein Lade_0259 [Legionella adelaidensis]VEH85202.1 Protein of uncharacterised function (DUF2803) [Legionella adelaidensis]